MYLKYICVALVVNLLKVHVNILVVGNDISILLMCFIFRYISVNFFLLDEGIDTRIHCLKVITEKEREPGLNKDLFTSSELIR